MSEQINVQISADRLVNKKQNMFIAKCSLIAGLAFVAIFLAAFFIGRYAFEKMSIEDYNTLVIIGTVSLIVGIVLSVIVSFKGTNASYLLIGSSYLLYCASIILMFSAYFSLINNDVLFYSLAFTALSLIIIGIISFLIPDKVAFSIMKIGSIAFIVYLLVSIIGSLIINFTYTPGNIKTWQIIVNAIIGLVIICLSISTFYSIKQTNEFLNITSIDKQTENKMLLLQSFSLLTCIVNIFMFILRIMALVKNN